MSFKNKAGTTKKPHQIGEAVHFFMVSDYQIFALNESGRYIPSPSLILNAL